MKKFFLSVLFCTCAAVCLFMDASAHGDTVHVYVDGEYIAASGRLMDDNTVIPMRAFFEKLGFTVEWNGVDKSVRAHRGGDDISLVIGRADMTVNGAVRALPCASFEDGGVTYLPVRAVAESVGYTVDWYESANAAVLHSGDAASYLPDTPTLLPELGAAVGTSHFTRTATDSLGGEVYYVYENVPEQKAHEYGDLLCSKLGYEYDSMILGEDYSKTYYYSFENFRVGIKVATVDSVPYVYLCPGSVKPEQPMENSFADTGEVEQMPGDSYDDKDGDDGWTDESVFYDGTEVPTYEYVCGYPLKRIDTLRGGETVYVYDGGMMDAMSYMSFLSSVGYVNYNIDMGGFNMTYTMVREGKYVVIMTSMLTDEVYVVPQ